MWPEKQITLLLAPKQPIRARIVALTAELTKRNLTSRWWDEDCIDASAAATEIDRFWNWNSVEVEFEGRRLPHAKVAAVTGQGEHLAIQGAMVISTVAVASVIEPGSSGCLLVEYLFTAPRNRPDVRIDRKNYVIGVGTQLLIWGAQVSRSLGHAGRLRLDASPKFVDWYAKRGLQRLKFDPILYEDTPYSPMELPTSAAATLLSAWD